MSEREFFGRSFLEKEITFDQGTALPSRWTLIEKLGDKNDQADQNEFMEYPDIPSAAYGVFLCQNVADPADTAVVKICMQIPYAGSEIATQAERERQAQTTLTYYAQELVDTLQTLTANGCQSTPVLRHYKQTTQDNQGIVPNGFIVYLLMTRLPGVQLDRTSFWLMEREVRDAIRAGFKDAWLESMRAGVLMGMPCLDHMFYDPSTGKVHLIGFRLARQPGPNDIWKDTDWIAGGLAKAPQKYRWVRETQAHPDMSEWTL